jgi:site-specific recombinase XerD
MFRSLQKRAGINPTKRYHELRAAFATKMIEGYGLNRAADALGHSNVQTTRKYNRKSEMSLVADMGNIAEKCYQSNVP